MRADIRRFSRETLCFLLAACGFAAALYVYAVSVPIALQRTAAMSTCDGPAPLFAPESPPVKPEMHYLEGGRKSPFLAPRRMVACPKPDPADDVLVSGDKRLGGKNIGNEKGKDTSRVVDEKFAKPDAELMFVGTVFIGGRTCGLLQVKDDAKRLCVKAGDVLSEYGCTVTRIEKQAIHLVNRRQRPIVLTDGRRYGGVTKADDQDESRDAKPKPADRKQRELPQPHSQTL
jgi:hypothetical protein